MMGFIDGGYPMPKEQITSNAEGATGVRNNPDYVQWRRSDRLLRGWITGTLSEEVLGLVVGLETFAEVWSALLESFARDSQEREFYLNQKLQFHSRKDCKSMADYIRIFKEICDDLAAIGQPVHERQKVFGLLKGLGHETMKTFHNPEVYVGENPNVAFVGHRHQGSEGGKYFKRGQQGQQRQTSFNSNGLGFVQTRGFSTRGANHNHPPATIHNGPQKQKQKGEDGAVMCQICNKTNHTAIDCWQRFNQTYQPDNAAQALATMTIADSQDNPWFPDTGATQHMTADHGKLRTCAPYFGSDKIMVGNVSQLTQQLPYDFEFSANDFVIKHRETKRVIAKGNRSGGLYALKPRSDEVFFSTRFRVVTVNVWHQRLGHPNMRVVKYLKNNKLISSSQNKSLDFNCSSCQLGKACRLPFLSIEDHCDNPIERIHCDLWGPAPVASVQKFKYYVIFVDECTRFEKGSNETVATHNQGGQVKPAYPFINIIQSDFEGADVEESETHVTEPNHEPTLEGSPLAPLQTQAIIEHSAQPQHAATDSHCPSNSAIDQNSTSSPEIAHPMTTRSQSGIVKANPKYSAKEYALLSYDIPAKPKSIKSGLSHPGFENPCVGHRTVRASTFQTSQALSIQHFMIASSSFKLRGHYCFEFFKIPLPLPLRALRLCCYYFFELCSAISLSSAPQHLQALLRRFFKLCSAPPFARALLRGAAPATQVDLWVHDLTIGTLALDWDLSPDSHHLSRWYTELSREPFDHGKSIFISNNALLLRSSLHKKYSDSERFLLLGYLIINGDAKWGNTTPQFGEISFIDRYWEWLEDVLSRNKDMLTSAKIYDAATRTNRRSVYFSMGLTGGLSIDGIFYDEVVSSGRELTGVDKKDVPLLPPSCKYLFLAYHKIYCASKTSNVTMHDWVKFWFKEEPRYKQPLARVLKKRLGEPRTSNNPTGFIGEKKPRSKDTEKVFDDLGVEKDVKEETNLATPLSYWLCVFVLPNKEVDQIRPGVFKVASMMAQGKRFSLAVPVIASIYHGLREITSSHNPSTCGTAFPIHYVYGWLDRYYDSYFLSASTKFDCVARMVRLAREKKAKHFSFQEACDLLKNITPSILSHIALGKPQQGFGLLE
ncbi:hypothetical protein RHSIM_Rhsim08G0105700 [Rhododendron simsii]|uniref:GAG-pre-integrase domain-containing protein n=1 Tax=Rhododendron simsii TaxID=118357 RepID=A0A834GIB3_RHOSS|nr:hypothetical protein RHSIM_Rhsim08G0105700 [Rhododendron simsii]